MKFARIFVTLILLFAIKPATMADSITGVDTVKKHLATLQSDPDNKEAVKAVAFHYLNIGDNKEAEKYGKHLIELAKKNDDRDFCELYGKIVLGAVATFIKEPDEAFELLQQALAIAESTNNIDALISANNSLGIYYLFINNDPYTAISHYYTALEYAKKINDNRREAIITSNIAGCYLTRNDISGKAIAEEAHELAIKRGEMIPLYYAKSNLVQFYLLTDSLDIAEKLITEIEKLHHEAGFSGDADMFLNRAQLAEKRNDTNNAYRYYALAMENFKNVDASSVTATYLSYAKLLRKEKRLGAAITVLEHAVTFADDSNMPIHTPEILRELALCYRDSGNNAKALEYSLEYQQHQDSAMTINRERMLQETRIKHDIYSREQKINEQKIELLANRNKITVLISILAALVILLGMLYYIHRKKDRLYHAIVKQNSEYISRERVLLDQIEKAGKHEKITVPTTATATSTLPEEKLHDLIGRFTACMIEQKLFTDPSLTVASVADRLGTNRTYLSKAINESTGKTFTQIVNDYRIREAIVLISDLKANLPLKQIAAEVGFNSISTFYVTFQASTGMTPARYRSKLKEI